MERLPRIIQGGMGVGVSSYPLAQAVAQAGELGVVSGTALDFVYARRLQLGDPGGHVRRAFARFPVAGVADRVLERYFIPGGKGADEPFRSVPMYTVTAAAPLLELTVLANFAEVSLAKEGHGGAVGINYLHKIELPLLPAMYGAILGGVDYVIVGAGSPEQIPAALTRLSRHEDTTLLLHVHYATSSDGFCMHFSPRALFGDAPALLRPVRRPRMLAIVASVDLARALAEGREEPPDGFVIEGPTAGGHNAPPRGPIKLDGDGQPIYGPLDEVDLSAFRALGRPFWLAGSYGTREGLDRALAAGAAGVQVGTAFAFCEESGLRPDLKAAILASVRRGEARVRTDPRASPSGFPFKVVQAAGTLSEPEVFAERRKACDIGLLRAPYKTKGGDLGYRCPSEPDAVYGKKDGRPENTVGRKCLCNALLSTIGLGQRRSSGYEEPPIVTAGDDLTELHRLLPQDGSSYSAESVIRAMTGAANGRPPPSAPSASAR